MTALRHMHSRPSKTLCHPGRMGYTETEARAYIGEEKWAAFEKWLDGQTMAYCSGCGQSFIYEYDVKRFRGDGTEVWD